MWYTMEPVKILYHYRMKTNKQSGINTLKENPTFYLSAPFIKEKISLICCGLLINSVPQSGADFSLVLAGTKRWWTKDMENAYTSMTHSNRILFTGRLPDQDLYSITAAAFALTYVSLFEGFGIPIVEAFRCDVPVICSNTTSMPEVAGDAAILVDPASVDEIAGGMLEMYRNDSLREDLIIKGRKRHTIFNWDKTAEDLWQSMMKTLSK